MNGLRTVTVRQLIELLESEDPDTPVVFAADYGDRGHTEQALGLRGEIEEATLVEAAYSDSGWRIATEGAPVDAPVVLVLR